MVCSDLNDVVLDQSEKGELTMKTYIKPSLRNLGLLRQVTKFSF